MTTPLLLPDAFERDLTEALAELETNGFARLGPVLSPEGCDALRTRVDDLMLGRVTYPGLFFQREAGDGDYDSLVHDGRWTGPSLEYRKVEFIERDPLFRAWIENALFERIARARIDGGISLYRALLMTKSASGGTVLPFHQDGGKFWGVDRPPTLQIWTALDDAPREAGCIEFVPGTHLAGLATPNGGTVPADLVEAAELASRIVAVPVRAGEAIVIHNHVWHRSGRNETGRPRRAITACYMSAETKCLRKKRAPRQFVRLFQTSGAPTPG